MATQKPERLARQKALRLQRRGATIRLQGQNHTKQVPGLVDPTTGQPQIKNVLDGVVTSFNVEALRKLQGRLFYVEGVNVPVIDTKKAVSLDVIEIMAPPPNLMVAAPADSEQYAGIEAWTDFIQILTQDIPEAPMKADAKGGAQ